MLEKSNYYFFNHIGKIILFQKRRFFHILQSAFCNIFIVKIRVKNLSIHLAFKIYFRFEFLRQKKLETKSTIVHISNS